MEIVGMLQGTSSETLQAPTSQMPTTLASSGSKLVALFCPKILYVYNPERVSLILPFTKSSAFVGRDILV